MQPASLSLKALKGSDLKMYAQRDTPTLFLEEFVKRMIIKSLKRTPGFENTDVLLEKLEKTSAIPPEIEITKKIEQPKPAEKIELRILSEKPAPSVQQAPAAPAI